MSALDDRPFPRGALIGAGLLAVVTIAGVGLHQAQKFEGGFERQAEVAPVLQSRTLRFVDGGGGVNAFGGRVSVYDAVDGAKIADLVETDGFIRTVLNSLAFERTKSRITADTVFTIVLRADRHLTLEDPLTGQSVNLGAFGGANRTVFLRFLPDPAVAS
jgi:putative photosynthetic complex assembly protein